MRQRFLAFFLTLAAGQATLVDRIAITVGPKVITASEVTLRIRLTAFENNVEPVFNPKTRRQSAEKLIDQKLVEREMDIGHYPGSTPASRAALLPEYAKTYFGSEMPALSRALLIRGLTMADLEEDLSRQADLLTFLSLRFKPAVQVSDTEVRRYFSEKIRPAPGEAAVSIEDVRERIEAQLTADLADADMEAWLREQRKRTRIEYLDQDLAP